MIHYITPYSLTKNLGQAYNAAMSIIPDGDTACFTDGDIMFLTPNFGHIIQMYAEHYPDAILTAYTNRIHTLSKQLYRGVMDDDFNVKDNIRIAESLKDKTTVTEILPGEGMSGLLMVIPKHIWNKVPFIENNGCLGVDSQFRIDIHNAGVKIYIMDAMLILHNYRLLNGSQYKGHLL